MLFILLRLLLLPYIVFGMLYSNFYLFQAIFLLCWFILDLLVVQECVVNFYVPKRFPAFLLLLISRVMLLWSEVTWCDFNLLKFADLFVAYNMIYSGECSCVFEKNCVFSCLGWNVLYFSVWFFWSNVWFMPCFFFFCCCCWFFLDDLSLTKTGVGKSPTNIVSFSLQVC